MQLKAKIKRFVEIATTSFSGDPQRKGTLAKVHYDQQNGIGNVPFNANVNYEGFAVIMDVKTFLSCVPPRGGELSADAAKLILSDRGIGSPFLLVDFDDDETPKVIGHEGRGRAAVIGNAYGHTTPLLVHIKPSNGRRARHVKPDWLTALYNGVLAEKSNKLVSKPISPIIWFKEAWQHISNIT